MKKQIEKPVDSLNSFNESVSLWQLLPAGSGKALTQLRTIADSILNSSLKTVPRILISGDAGGKKTFGRAFIRSLGMDQIKELDASLITSFVEFNNFFSEDENDCYLINSIEKMPLKSNYHFFQILQDRKYSYKDWSRKTHEFCVHGAVIMTCNDLSRVSGSIKDQVDYVVQMEPHTEEQLKLVVLQRLKYSNMEYKTESVLEEIVRLGDGDLRQVIRLLRMIIAVVLADGRREICVEDVKKAEKII